MTRVGRYEIEGRLGGGGMAEVFLARLVGNEGFSRPVAIKRVLAHLADDAQFAQMFVSEAQLCAKLQHPNIVSVLDFDRDSNGRPYLVLELIDGPSLADLAAKGPLPAPVAIHIAAEILRALAYAHDFSLGETRGIIHRDISPHNVLLSWDGGVKLSDFGIAKARTATHATASEILKGKPAYMSPEQANGETLDGRSDLFAVGIVLWELLVGRSLFSGETTEEMLSRVLFAPIPSPHSMPVEVAADLDRVVMRLLSRERGDRFQSADEALAALVECEETPRDGRQSLTTLFAQRFPDRVKSARTESDERPAPRRRRSRRPWWLMPALLVAVSAAVATAWYWRSPDPKPSDPETAKPVEVDEVHTWTELRERLAKRLSLLDNKVDRVIVGFNIPYRDRTLKEEVYITPHLIYGMPSVQIACTIVAADRVDPAKVLEKNRDFPIGAIATRENNYVLLASMPLDGLRWEVFFIVIQKLAGEAAVLREEAPPPANTTAPDTK